MLFEHVTFKCNDCLLLFNCFMVSEKEFILVK